MDQGAYLTWRPPSTRIVSPVMKSLSSSATTAFAISISPPHRPSGVASFDRFRLLLVVPGGATIGPGAMALTRMWSARQLQRERFGQRDDCRPSPRSTAEVPGTAGGRSSPIQSLKLTMRPPPRRRMCGTAACAHRNAARRSTLSTASQSAVGQLVERLAHVNRRHVDQDVEAAEPFDDRRDQFAARLRL